MGEHSPVRALVESIGQGFAEFAPPPRKTSGDGPLDWPGYADQRARAAGRTDAEESVLCGRAKVGEWEAVLIAFDFAFLGVGNIEIIRAEALALSPAHREAALNTAHATIPTTVAATKARYAA